MVIAGRVQNGVVILDPGISLPEGTEVTVSLREQKSGTPEATPEVNRSRQQAALARIDAIANENPGDPFSGADHDRILYGEAE